MDILSGLESLKVDMDGYFMVLMSIRGGCWWIYSCLCVIKGWAWCIYIYTVAFVNEVS